MYQGDQRKCLHSQIYCAPQGSLESPRGLYLLRLEQQFLHPSLVDTIIAHPDTHSFPKQLMSANSMCAPGASVDNKH